jgi:hypothetical protein
MSTDAPAHDDNAIEWTHATSEDGIKYVIGMPNSDDNGTADGGDDVIVDDGTLAGLAAEASQSQGTKFSAVVDWRVGPKFVPLWPEERKKAHIVSYRLGEVPVNPLLPQAHHHWKWMLQFSTPDMGAYEFSDEANRTYKMVVTRPMILSLKFNSDKPNIRKVAGVLH